MDQRRMSLVYSSSLKEIVKYNSSFDAAKLYVAYTGYNRNGSHISKEAFERSIKTMYNVPVVCNYNREEDEIGSHDSEIVKDDEGHLHLVNITQPVGVVPESATYSWEEIEEEDGEVHEYLVVDVLLWKRQEAYKKIKQDGVTKESMEITVKDGCMEDGTYMIRDFEFTAFCLLGTAEPCYESAALITFAKSEFKAQLDQMAAELAMTFADNREPIGDGNFDSDEKEENPLDNEMQEVQVEAELVEEQVVSEQEPEVDAEPDEMSEPIAEESFALQGQIREELCRALEQVRMETFWGECSRYWMYDYDHDIGEVYAYDQEDWLLYGFSYSMNGDNVVIDFDSKKRKKVVLADFDEGEETGFSFSVVVEAIQSAYDANNSQWQERYNALEQDNESLRAFRDKAEADKLLEAQRNVFSRFEDLVGEEAFDSLVNDPGKLTVAELEEKCYAIRGRTQKFAVTSTGTPKIVFDRSSGKSDENEPYGGIVKLYGRK